MHYSRSFTVSTTQSQESSWYHQFAVGWSIEACFHTGSNNSSLLQNTQTISGAHSASYAMGTKVPFHRNKVAVGWSNTSIPHMPSWHAQDNFILQ